ncbi:MAG: response regulator [Puniceicoccaceae bacterium]|nr:MAG: response regulator [Puniceicoccaceae bacterium]
MPYSILILDDDADFNSLLTDIYEQADYVVTSITDPLEAVDVFSETDYDLVVTDHKMPEMTGMEFMQAIKKVKPTVPVIMVSGYLENDTIRELISKGVGGVFLKPLNIFSLLERTSELLEETEKNKISSTESANHPEEDGSNARTAELGFDFWSYPCKTGVSAAFAEQLFHLRNFKSTLTLVGEPGTHFRRICDDICGFYESESEHFIYLNRGTFDEVQMLSFIEKAQKEEAERITVVILELESMDDVQKKLAATLAKREEPFDGLDIKIRVIFCLNDDLDVLFDLGLIDENLYILMGTAEVRVPPLRDCHTEVGIMAQQLIIEVAREKGIPTLPRLERAARDLLSQQAWKNNYEELSCIVRRLVADYSGASISVADVRAALDKDKVESTISRVNSYLKSQHLDYLRAASILFAGDRRRIGELFDLDESTIDSK